MIPYSIISLSITFKLSRDGAEAHWAGVLVKVLDDVRIYNVALTAEEIAALAQ